MSKAQKTLAALTLLLVLAILRWLAIARITHDEGYMLDVIAHFPSELVMQVVYNGIWGNRWVVTIGPTISLPLGLLAFVAGVHVVVARLYVFALCSATFALAGRLAGLSWRATASCACVFLFWVLALVWRPDINGSSINLIANVFGEGAGFCFALLCCLLAADPNPRRRQWAWLCAVLAVGSKAVAAIAVVAPLAYLGWLTVRAPAKKRLSALGPLGFGTALGVLLGWQVYLLAVLGRDEYERDWLGLRYWLGHGGGYHATQNPVGFDLTLTRKFEMMRLSHVEPWMVVALTLLAAGFVGWLARRKDRLKLDALSDSPAWPRAWRLIAASIAVFYFWFLFLAGRGWMRHLWIGYALLGWLAAAAAAQLLEKSRKHWPAVAALTSILALVSFFYGTLPALGPMGESERWQTQAALAEELAAKFPRARLMVIDWHMVPHIAFFMKRPQNNALELQPMPGDLFLCDTESGCDEEIDKYCAPQMTEARVAWCQYAK